jgi:hypothetical protein
MPTFDRTTIVRGPCRITYDGATFYSKGGVSLTLTNSTFDKETDAYGVVGRAKTDLQIVVEFEPIGEIESLTVLFPYGNTAMGASIYGGTDKPLVIVTTDGTYTVNNAAITQMPSIRCSANNTAFGSVQFTGLLDIGGDPASLADYYSVGASGVIGIAFDATKLITAPYRAVLGGTIGPFFSEAGFEINFDLSLNPVTVDGIGTVDMSLQNLGATISFIPTGISKTSFDTFFGSLDAGEELASSTLSITTDTGGGIDFDCAAVQLIDLQNRFSPTDNRLGQVTLAAKRTFSTGDPVALFTVAAAIPV